MMPLWEPVKLMASPPRAWMAMREQRHGHALPRRDQHVELAPGCVGVDAPGEGEQPVGRLAHRAHDDHDVASRPLRGDDAVGHLADLLDVRDRRAAVLLDDEAHDLRWYRWALRRPGVVPAGARHPSRTRLPRLRHRVKGESAGASASEPGGRGGPTKSSGRSAGRRCAPGGVSRSSPCPRSSPSSSSRSSEAAGQARRTAVTCQRRPRSRRQQPQAHRAALGEARR